ncbi:hypothetical protein BJX70DRAFT_381197 [Aspergillus crustosus]
MDTSAPDREFAELDLYILPCIGLPLCVGLPANIVSARTFLRTFQALLIYDLRP